MKNRQRQHKRFNPAAAQMLGCVGALVVTFSPAIGQDIRGLEVCTAEKQMDRRTGCLQSNIDFLGEKLNKLARDTQDKLVAAGRDLAAARAEIDALKSAIAKLNGELEQMKSKINSGGTK